jgi:hypothetical protein
MSIRVFGKGRRERLLPLWKTTGVGAPSLARDPGNGRDTGGVHQSSWRTTKPLRFAYLLVDGCLNPSPFGAGSEIAAKFGGAGCGSEASCRSHSFPNHRTDGGTLSGRPLSTPSAAEGPPLQWCAAQPQSAPRIDRVATHHFQVEGECLWADSLITRQRMHIEPFLPVISSRTLSPTGRYLSAMRSWPGIL